MVVGRRSFPIGFSVAIQELCYTWGGSTSWTKNQPYPNPTWRGVGEISAEIPATSWWSPNNSCGSALMIVRLDPKSPLRWNVWRLNLWEICWEQWVPKAVKLPRTICCSDFACIFFGVGDVIEISFKWIFNLFSQGLDSPAAYQYHWSLSSNRLPNSRCWGSVSTST